MRTLLRAQAYDQRHRFQRTAELVPYDFRGADDLVCDFFAAVEAACAQEDVPFAFEDADIDMEPEGYDDEDISG